MPDEQPATPMPKPERPRDEFGRPLPAGSPNRLELPDFDSMSLDQCHEAAIAYFDIGHYFAAHEAWETCWGLVKGSEDEEFFKGLAQLGAGYTHWARGNAHGVVALLGRALERLSLRGSPHQGIDVDAFMVQTAQTRERAQEAEQEGESLGALEGIRVPRA